MELNSNSQEGERRSSELPFKKIRSGKNKGKFRSPSGRVMSSPQVRAYYASKSGKAKSRG